MFYCKLLVKTPHRKRKFIEVEENSENLQEDSMNNQFADHNDTVIEEVVGNYFNLLFKFLKFMKVSFFLIIHKISVKKIYLSIYLHIKK